MNTKNLTPDQLNRLGQQKRNDNRLIILSDAIQHGRIEQEITEGEIYKTILTLRYNNGLTINCKVGHDVKLEVDYHVEWTLHNEINPLIVQMVKDKGLRTTNNLRVSIQYDVNVKKLAEVLADLANW